ncbi:MAG TPA: hypothetical protein VGG31_05080 [Candidatus Dormibacteraeota bacterium]
MEAVPSFSVKVTRNPPSVFWTSSWTTPATRTSPVAGWDRSSDTVR